MVKIMSATFRIPSILIVRYPLMIWMIYFLLI